MFATRQHPLFMQPRLADVTFIVGTGKGERRIPAHRQILALSSPVLEAMLYPPEWSTSASASASDEASNEEGLEIHISDVDADAFVSLLECIYTDETVIDSQNVPHLIYAAKKYQLEKLQRLCAKFVSSDINADNALEMFEVGPDLVGDAKLGLNYILENAESVLSADAIGSVGAERLALILGNQQLELEELEVFQCVMRWTKFQLKLTDEKESPETLQRAAKDILHVVRFPLLELSDIARHVAPSGLLTDSQLLELFTYRSAVAAGLPTPPISFNTAARGASSGGFKGSLIMTKEYTKEIRRLFGKKKGKSIKFKLVYRGTRDGMTGAQFHSKCDGTSRTLTVAKATNGNVFGGYYEGDWSPVPTNGQYDNTGNPWIFSLKNRTGKSIKMNSSGNNKVYKNSSYGPTWGGGHDLHFNNSMTSNSNYCNPNSYKTFAPESFKTNYDNSLIAGSYNFQVAEIEVYAVTK